jgi:hypothetical protein
LEVSVTDAEHFIDDQDGRIHVYGDGKGKPHDHTA